MDNDNGILQAENESLKRSNSGLDAKITELQKTIVDMNAGFQSKTQVILKEKADMQAIIDGNDNTFKERSAFVDRKENALNIALEKGIDPKQAFDLLGLSEGLDDEGRIDLLNKTIEGARLDERQKFARNNGVKPHFSLPKTTLSYQEILKMPDSEIKNIPTSVIERAQNEVSPKKKTTRERLKNWGKK